MDCWSQVRALEGDTLHTLHRNRPFEIIAVDGSQVLIKLSTGKARPVRRQEIEGTFDELVQVGGIDLKAIGERHSPRSTAYVAAILARLDGVRYQLKPVRLLHRPGQDPAGSVRQASLMPRAGGRLSARSIRVLNLIAGGHTYEQILTLHPELTHEDIYDAAREALEANTQRTEAP
jgi:hypothetical protein